MAIGAKGRGLPPNVSGPFAWLSKAGESIYTKLDELVSAIKSLTLRFQGWPHNADGITALRVAIAITGTHLPYIAVPSGMVLIIKAWALNPAGSWLQVGGTLGECVNVNQSFPLLPSEVVGYQVQNANQIWIAATAAPSFASLTVEQRRRGEE